MSTWSRIAQASGGAITEDDLERAAVRLATYQVIYAGDHGARHAYDLITMNLPAYQAVFAPFGRTVIHRASAGYVVVLSKHRVSPRMPLVQTRLAIVLRRLFNDKMERADTIDGEIVCETLELQHAWTEYLKLEWKFRVGDLEDALTALKSGNWQIASAHCLLSFANPATALMQFEDTPCALEGDALATQALAQVFAQIGARCFALAAKDKLLYHAGAVFATNFLPVLQSVAQQLWRDSGMPADLVTTMQATLLKNAVDNLLALGPAGALTGPAARGDVALVQRQAKAVTDWDTTAGDAYKALSQLAIRLASHPAPPIKDSTLFNQ